MEEIIIQGLALNVLDKLDKAIKSKEVKTEAERLMFVFTTTLTEYEKLMSKFRYL